MAHSAIKCFAVWYCVL